MDSKQFFNDNENKKIEDTIKTIEKNTSGEIVAMVVNQSDDYIEIDLILSFILSIIFSFITLYFLPDVIYLIKASFITKIISIPYQLKNEFRYILLYSLYFFVPLFIIYFALIKYLLSRYFMVKGILISRLNKSEAVRSRALRAFYEHGLYKTRDQTGVLFLISLLEKRVYILADKGIYEKITQQKLDEYARIVSEGIKENKACDALCRAIISCGEILEEYFPIKPDDTNELPNSVITE